jgi:hypothetical protein
MSNMQAPPADSDDWELTALDSDDLDKAWTASHNCADRGSKLLCEHARIPDACIDQFRDEVGEVLVQTYLRYCMYSKTIPAETIIVIEKFEKAIREAYSIFLLLPEEWRRRFHFVETYEPPKDDILAVIQREKPWDSILQRMIHGCANYTGRHPRVAAKRGRGRRRGDSTKKTYLFKNFVFSLARVVRRHGGGLTLYRLEQSGTWIDALNGLRPLFPKGFIPDDSPLSMIEEIQAKANKHPL